MNENLFTPGTIVLGKYRIEKLLGMGAMGVVVAATHLGLNQKVALKFMLPGKVATPERYARFLREARIAVKLTSLHVARVLDVGTLEDGGAPYMVMEFLAGSDLGSVLAQGGVLPIQEAVGHVLQVCEAIAEAHAAGIIHRDLKPANLFLTRTADGASCVKVLDFGVSKLNDGELGLTKTEATLGSPLYMPPEQMGAAKDVDGRADVWSIGVVMYELIAGRTPFHAETLQGLLVRIMEGAPTPLATLRSDAPPGLEAVLLRCFERQRDRRWPNVAELAAALVPYGPGRAVIHAERAAAMLGVSGEPSRPTEVLPPPQIVTLARPPIASGVGESLGAAVVAQAPPPATKRRARLGAGAALGAGALAILGAVALVVSRLGGGSGASPAPTVVAAAPPVPAPSATSSSAEALPAPVVSATASAEPPARAPASVPAVPPRSSAPVRVASPRPIDPPKPAASSKKNIYDQQ